ncbi:hypothetical protein ACFLR3_03065 [Campylobacterota bacterium]
MKKFPKIVIFASLLILLIIGSFNYTIDPLWCFSHKNSFNQYQMGWNERQGKTNVINFQNFDYNALMLGTSRVTYINRHDIKEYKAFNYAVAKMRPSEYSDYTEYAKQKLGKEFDIIFLGIDFGSAEVSTDNEYTKHSEYKNTSESFLYRYKTLFSLDTIKYSAKNVSNYTFDKYKKRVQTYNRDLIVSSYPKSEGFINSDLSRYLTDVTRTYDEKYKQTLLEFKHNNPNTKFYVFTTPLTAPRFKSIMANSKNVEFYKRWLKETLEVFGEVNNFMTLNKVTNNYVNTYTGVSHFYPFVGTHIVNKVFGYPDNDPFYDDFGVRLTQDNFDEEFSKIITSLK